MSFLAPWAFLAALSIPALIWLWRFSATQHRTVVPSLAPFAHLLRRPPSRRTRLLVNALFWLQLAALILLTAALAEPVRLGRHPRTTLVLLDTSASMRAGSAWPKATQGALSWLARRGPDERVVVVQTAPPTAMTGGGEVFDPAQLSAAVRALDTADTGGNLSVARRIGQALLGRQPDATVVFTDEPAPDPAPADTEFRAFSESLPNVAITGLDASESLCLPAAAQMVVTLQNFSDQEQEAAVTLHLNGRRVAQQTVTLPPEARMPVSFAAPEQAGGMFEARVSARQDALASDNQAWALLRGEQPFPVVVASDRPAFTEQVGRWLDACPRATWKEVPDSSGAVLVTDDEARAASWPSAVVLFARQPAGQPPVVAQSLTGAAHPISEYVQPLEAIPGVVLSGTTNGAWGDPVLWGIAAGRRLPLIRAASSGGRRAVSLMTDPVASGSSVASVVVFFNSLRWLSGTFGSSLAGEPLVVGPFAAGTVVIQPPRGSAERRAHAGGWLTYDATDQAGRYRFSQGRLVIERAVNALDPLESNTRSRVSTWTADSPGSPPSSPLVPPRRSLTAWLLMALAVVLFAEWVLYVWTPKR